MVVATQNGAQTPYNFPTQSKAQQFMQGLSGIDGVQLLKMQGNPAQYHNDKQVATSAPPALGKRIQPKLLGSNLLEWNPEVLCIPGLEWAGYCNYGGVHRYELIGHRDALSALSCVEPHMLTVGISRKRQGERYETQTLVNDRFRLELRLSRKKGAAGRMTDDACLVHKWPFAAARGITARYADPCDGFRRSRSASTSSATCRPDRRSHRSC